MVESINKNIKVEYTSNYTENKISKKELEKEIEIYKRTINKLEVYSDKKSNEIIEHKLSIIDTKENPVSELDEAIVELENERTSFEEKLETSKSESETFKKESTKLETKFNNIENDLKKLSDIEKSLINKYNQKIYDLQESIQTSTKNIESSKLEIENLSKFEFHIGNTKITDRLLSYFKQIINKSLINSNKELINSEELKLKYLKTQIEIFKGNKDINISELKKPINNLITSKPDLKEIIKIKNDINLNEKSIKEYEKNISVLKNSIEKANFSKNLKITEKIEEEEEKINKKTEIINESKEQIEKYTKKIDISNKHLEIIDTKENISYLTKKLYNNDASKSLLKNLNEQIKSINNDLEKYSNIKKYNIDKKEINKKIENANKNLLKEHEVDTIKSEIRAYSTYINELEKSIKELSEVNSEDDTQEIKKQEIDSTAHETNDIAKNILKIEIKEEGSIVEVKVPENKIEEETKKVDVVEDVKVEEKKASPLEEKINGLEKIVKEKKLDSVPLLSLLKVCMDKDPEGAKPLTQKLLALSNDEFLQKDNLPPLLSLIAQRGINKNDTFIDHLIADFPKDLELTASYEKLPPLLKLHSLGVENHLIRIMNTELSFRSEIPKNTTNEKQELIEANAKHMTNFYTNIIGNLDDISLTTKLESLPPSLKMMLDLKVEGENPLTMWELLSAVTYGDIKDWKKDGDNCELILSKNYLPQYQYGSVLGALTVNKEIKFKFNSDLKSLVFDEKDDTRPSAKVSVGGSSWVQALYISNISINKDGKITFANKFNIPWGFGWIIDSALKLMDMDKTKLSTASLRLETLKKSLNQCDWNAK